MMRRPFAIVAVLATLGAPIAVDRFVNRSSPPEAVRAADINPSATATASGTSTWFCGSGRTGTDGQPDLTVTVSNPTADDVPGRITWFAEEIGRAPVVQALLAEANSRNDVTAPSAAAGGAIAALVEFDAGGIAAEQRVVGTDGGAGALCASDANARWITADGSTTIDSSTTLSVFNPFPEDALLDVRFVTDRGAAIPAALQGMSIPARSVQRINVGDFVRRRQRVASIVRARIGRVVVGRTTTFDGSGTAKGTTISPASSTPSPTWYFAAGAISAIRREHYAMFNPTRQPVTAIIDVLVDGVAGVEPFEIDIPALGLAELVPGSESRIPRGVGYSVVVTTADGTPIVVERTIDATGRLRRGYASSPGIVAPAERWIISNAETSSRRMDDVALLNPTDSDAVISFQTIGPNGLVAVGGAQDVVVGPSARLDVRLGDYTDVSATSLILSSPGTPIIVERTSQRVAKTGDRPEVIPLPTVVPPGIPPSPVTAPSATTASVAAPARLALVAVAAPSTVPVGVATSSSSTTTTTTTTVVVTSTAAAAATTSVVVRPTTVAGAPTTTTVPATPAHTAVVRRLAQAATGLSVGGAIPLP